ncbi:MAG: hypothetical protein ACKOWG_15230 [Planctomycetia bacterium]
MAGCGPPATTVAGVVTLDGKPVANAILEFIPERGDVPAAAVQADGSGRYSVRVSPVPFRVAIMAQRSTGEKKVVMRDEQPVEIFEEIMPARYTNPSKSELRVEAVEQQRTIANFDLSSKAETSPATKSRR